MFGLSQSSGYAVAALTALASGGNRRGFVRDLAASSDVPKAYLAKIFKKLVNAGILKAKRGWAGGTRLARPARDISLFEIARVIDGEDWTTKCLLGLAECSDERACPAHAFWKAERARIEAKLREISLADVIRLEARRAKAVLSPQTKNTQPSFKR
ncbi:MAG: hypothetical protein OHK005_00420 [Candidatus Methylacidiphilales bacterium]